MSVVEMPHTCLNCGVEWTVADYEVSTGFQPQCVVSVCDACKPEVERHRYDGSGHSSSLEFVDCPGCGAVKGADRVEAESWSDGVVQRVVETAHDCGYSLLERDGIAEGPVTGEAFVRMAWVPDWAYDAARSHQAGA